MQQNPLLQTKLGIPPIRPKSVSRPRLIERLNAALPSQSEGRDSVAFTRKLTLISAPAGFGKTTLVSDWVGSLRSGGAREDRTAYGIAWLSVDESDDDPTRFLAYLIAALQTLALPALSPVEGVEAHIGKRALGILRSPQPPPTEAILTSLINELAAIPGRIILVLDDYHLIEAPPIQNALTFLLEHMPPRMHLVIATRVDPPLPLARLRARGQLTELRASDLRFSSSEAAEFLNQVMGLDLSAEDVAALEGRTEGWIAGLQLAAISMQGQEDAAGFIKSFTGSHRFVLDYLVEEVLDRQPGDIQGFLLQTSILEPMTAPLCEFVTDRDDGQAILETLERANLFIVPLDEERCWYRYHQLFADLLRHRLRQTRPPEQVLALHRGASAWYEQKGFTGEAIEHALRGEDFGQAATLIEAHFGLMYQRGEHTRLRRWLAGLPLELVYSKPHLCVFRAWDLFTSGHLGAAERSLKAAERMLVEGDLSPRSERMRIQGMASAVRAFLAYYRGDAPGTIHSARRALDYLPERDLTWRSTAAIALGDGYCIGGDIAAAYQARLDALATSKETGDMYLSTIANLKVAVTLRQQGQLQRVIEICQRQYQLANESGLSQTVVVGWLLAMWGEVLAELNDLDRARRQATRGVELTEGGRDVAMLGWSNSCLVRVLFSKGDMAGAERIIRKMESIAQEQDVPPWVRNRMAAWQARIWLAEDRMDSASQWVQERGLEADGGPVLLHEMQYRVLARILMAQGRLDESARLLKGLLETAETGGQTSRAIEILMLQALAFQAGGDTAGALSALERALVLAEPGGFIRIFVDEGPPMVHLLCQAVTRGIKPDYVGKLLAAFEDTAKDEGRTTETASLSSVLRHSPLVEPLSERELEVLQLIAAGLTNRDIASRLFLSLNTVKAHTRNIYGKLNVHSRTQAVARCRALGLLPHG